MNLKSFLILLLPLVFILGSCSKGLYSWHDYEIATYAYTKKSQEKDVENLLESYQKIIEKQKGSREVPPPGICADYGFLLLQNNKTEEGEKLLKREMKLYPESKVFVSRILKMVEK